jgi:hypothetical protein
VEKPIFQPFQERAFLRIDQREFICYDEILSEFNGLQPQGHAFEPRGPSWKQPASQYGKEKSE